MNDAVSQLPLWAQWGWMIAAVATLGAAIGWTLMVIWPYLKHTRKRIDQSFEMGKKSSETLDRVAAMVEPLVEEAMQTLNEVNEVIAEYRKHGDFKKVSVGIEKLNSILEKADKAMDSKDLGWGEVIGGVVGSLKDIRDSLRGQ